MIKSQICIVIPIYKTVLNEFEVQAVLQCIKVLSGYSIIFVGPQELDMTFYKTNFPSIQTTVFFKNIYFENLKGYNKLLLNPEFYKSFTQYEYMLVYQTDSYVFRDELLDWANKGYDYIGGIWFDDYHGTPQLDAKIWHPGNGGLSLRKIDKVIKILTSSSYPLKSLKQLAVDNKKNLAVGRKAFLNGLFKIPYKFLSRKNNLKHYVINFEENEDVLFMELSLKFNKIRVPSVSESIGFSWDRLPFYLHSKVGHLPFGCHAWYREDHCYEGNKEFWMQYIDTKQSND